MAVAPVDVGQDEVTALVAVLVERDRATFLKRLRRMVHNVHFSSDRSDYRTPPDLFAVLDQEFRFNLDPAADDVNHLCRRYFTERDDGLAQSWQMPAELGDVTRAYVNPPYGRVVASWLHKGYHEAVVGHAKSVFLIAARPGTRAWKRSVLMGSELRFVKGRVKFVLPDGTVEEAGAPFPSVLVIFDYDQPTFGTGAPKIVWDWTWK